MQRYVVRSVKYLIWILIIFFVIFAMMNITGTSEVKGLSGLMAMAGTERGKILMAVIVALALAFPLVGFIKRTVNGTFDKSDIDQTMKSIGYKLSEYKGDSMVFHATNPMKKLSTYFEDRIEICVYDKHITIDGRRKDVFIIEYRLNKMLVSKRD